MSRAGAVRVTKLIELWADSFHEGDWAGRQLGALVIEAGGEHVVSYQDGFIPHHVLSVGDIEIELVVYGSYRAWEPLPQPIADLIDWGKPDLVAFDPIAGAILFAVEETAATPTGNQALQRCERQYGAARQGVPFWYLLSEFGTHSDGGIRRDSIWPTVMALKLSQDKHLPSVVLHYSNMTNPEDYSAGTGLRSLFSALLQILINSARGIELFTDLAEPLRDQYQNMLNFVTSQWRNQIQFLPGEDVLSSESVARDYAQAAAGSIEAEEIIWSQSFLRWPKTTELPAEVAELQQPRSLIKPDPLGGRLEADVARGRAYGLSTLSGSRPQPRSQVDQWIGAQKVLFESGPALPVPAECTLDLADFPVSAGGLLHLTTCRRIVYLYDRWGDVRSSIEAAYPRLSGRVPTDRDEEPVLVYISNSLKPGRIFGDPFTGQIAAYAVAFGKLDVEPRMVIAYFPHQAHTQAVLETRIRRNKGLYIMRELTDYLLFTGGVLLSLQSGVLL